MLFFKKNWISASSLRRGGHNALLINCPTCEHHVCDFHNLTQCEVCKIYIPHENQPPVDVRCVPVSKKSEHFSFYQSIESINDW